MRVRKTSFDYPLFANKRGSSVRKAYPHLLLSLGSQSIIHTRWMGEEG